MLIGMPYGGGSEKGRFPLLLLWWLTVIRVAAGFEVLAVLMEANLKSADEFFPSPGLSAMASNKKKDGTDCQKVSRTAMKNEYRH